MGAIDVASVVASILAAFSSSLDVLNRISGKKRKTRARRPRPDEEEEWLRRSLTGRPLEIQTEYDKSRARHGHHFETGDAPAHSSLAHTLLVMNTGLINLLNTALSRGDSRSRATSKRTLYNLSETAAIDTLTALGQLNSRLSMRVPVNPTPRDQGHEDPTKRHSRHKREISSTSSSKPSKRPPPSPLLARGGWVRSKSGSSVVSAAEARRARDELEGNHKSRSTSSLPKSSASQVSLLTKPRKGKSKRSIPNDSITGAAGQTHEKRRTLTTHDVDVIPLPHRQPSMLLVSSDFFEDPAQQQYQHHQPPEIPVLAPTPSNALPSRHTKSHIHTHPHIRPHPRTSGIRPTSTATFLSTSTKIGEIPDYKQLGTNMYHQSRRIPPPIPPPLEPQAAAKKVSKFKFWRRDDRTPDMVVV